MKINEEIYYLLKYAFTNQPFHGAINPVNVIRDEISKNIPRIHFSDIEDAFFEVTQKPLNDYSLFLDFFGPRHLKNTHKKFFQSIITLRKAHPFLYKTVFKYGFYSAPENKKGFNCIIALTYQDIVYFQKKNILSIACGESKLDILASLFCRERFKESNYLWNKAKLFLDKEEVLNMLIIFAKANVFDDPVRIWKRFEEQATDNFKKNIIDAIINIDGSDIKRVFNNNYISDDMFNLLNTQSYAHKVVLADIYQFLNMSSAYFQNKELSSKIICQDVPIKKTRERL